MTFKPNETDFAVSSKLNLNLLLPGMRVRVTPEGLRQLSPERLDLGHGKDGVVLACDYPLWTHGTRVLHDSGHTVLWTDTAFLAPIPGASPWSALLPPSAAPGPDDPLLWHWMNAPGLVACGSDHPNMRKTEAMICVTCPTCRQRHGEAGGAVTYEPGPLNDDGLRVALCDPRLASASPLLDRVQDAFERLLREKTGLTNRLEAVNAQRLQLLEILEAGRRGDDARRNGEAKRDTALDIMRIMGHPRVTGVNVIGDKERHTEAAARLQPILREFEHATRAAGTLDRSTFCSAVGPLFWRGSESRTTTMVYEPARVAKDGTVATGPWREIKFTVSHHVQFLTRYGEPFGDPVDGSVAAEKLYDFYSDVVIPESYGVTF